MFLVTFSPGLDACLIMDVHHAFSASSGKHHVHYAFKSLLEFVVLLHRHNALI